MLITLISLRKREWLLHHKNNWNFIFISRFISDDLEYQSGFFVFFFCARWNFELPAAKKNNNSEASIFGLVFFVLKTLGVVKY